MNEVNKTLYIPLYGKAYVSQRGIILHDPKAEMIWAQEGFALKGKSKSKWLAYNMGMRSAVFDRWVEEETSRRSDAIVLHIGCGLDSRAERAKHHASLWVDIDFPDVIAERKKYFAEQDAYRMIGADVREENWLQELPGGHAIVVMEGVSMYLGTMEMKKLLCRLSAHFESVFLLADFYTTFAAKASKYKNPINDVGVTAVYGMDDPKELEAETGFAYVREHDLTPMDMIASLSSAEQMFFRLFFAGKMAKGIYRLYEYRT